MWITWLVMLRQIPETSNGTSIVRKKTSKVFHLWKGRMERVLPQSDRSAPFMDDVAVSKDGVIKLLKGLNPSKALGPDELHPRILKELATELGPVFAHFFQQSVDTGEVPKESSLTDICPLFKKSDRSLACNYHAVSFDLCAFQVTRTHSMFKYHGSSWWI